MISFPAGVKVWIAGGVTDMRCGMNSLALKVQQGLGRDPHGGEVVCFRGRKGDLIKVLWHDGVVHVSLPEAAGSWKVHLAGQPEWLEGNNVDASALQPTAFAPLAPAMRLWRLRVVTVGRSPHALYRRVSGLPHHYFPLNKYFHSLSQPGLGAH